MKLLPTVRSYLDVLVVVPGTAAIRRRRQSMKPQVEVKSMNHRPATDCSPCRCHR